MEYINGSNGAFLIFGKTRMKNQYLKIHVRNINKENWLWLYILKEFNRTRTVCVKPYNICSQQFRTVYSIIRTTQTQSRDVCKACILDNSTNFQPLPQAAYFLWYCDKIYHKQEVCFLLYFLCQIVSWQYKPNLLD